MNNDLKVSLENIIPLTYARDHFSSIVTEVQKDKLYILTKGGKPAIALIDVRYLEQITAGGFDKAKIEKDIEKIPEQVGKPKMLEHKPEPKPTGFAAPQPKVAEQPKPAGFAAPQPPPSKPVIPPPSKPFDSAPSKELGTSQGKPAPKKEVFDINSDLPKDNPPDLSQKTIPITEKPEPAATVSNFTRPDTASPTKPLTFPQKDANEANEVKPTPAPPAPSSNQPSTPASSTPTIDVDFNQDTITDQKEKAANKESLSPDDKVQPAQYGGETPAGNEEPDEMVID